LRDHPEGRAKHETEQTQFVVRGGKFVKAAIQPEALEEVELLYLSEVLQK
jgi:hypothetical protein